MSSDRITYKTGHERADWLAVYMMSWEWWSGREGVHCDSMHEFACDDADRAIQAMRDRDRKASEGVRRG